MYPVKGKLILGAIMKIFFVSLLSFISLQAFAEVTISYNSLTNWQSGGIDHVDAQGNASSNTIFSIRSCGQSKIVSVSKGTTEVGESYAIVSLADKCSLTFNGENLSEGLMLQQSIGKKLSRITIANPGSSSVTGYTID
jgi:hypothetical protein